MGLAKLKVKTARTYTVGEYLQLDRDGIERYQYLDGEVFLMAGESIRHGDISANLTGELRDQLKGIDCRVLSKDTKTKSGGLAANLLQSRKGLFSYPDLVVICGEPEFQDDYRDIVLNPRVIIEVLSDSTEMFDRRDKLMRYRLFNPTLTDYILVSQDKPLVEHYIRQADGDWKMILYFGTEETLNIESIKCGIKLSEIYDRVKFTTEEQAFIREIKNERI
ncbi:MAG: Uma2 family endonuclease [Pyrinomonadaceae bacterium]|nr:Uma2 family endonuclease [Pyrinomonadaceae bacterium]